MKRLSIIFCLAFILTSTASCSDEQPKESIPATSTETTIDTTEAKEDIILTIANCFEDKELFDMIKEFNEENNGYKVEIKDYTDMLVFGDPESQSDVSMESMDAMRIQMYQDVIRGEIDIVNANAVGEAATFEIMEKQGAFADLYKFMDKDEAVNRSALNETVLKLNEMEGKLYSIPTFFVVNTMVGESQYVGTKENWTFEELKSHWAQMPQGATIGQNTTREYVYMCLLRNMLHEFVDYKEGTASFDSPKFRDILQFCNDNFESSENIWGSDQMNFDAPMFLDDLRMSGIMDYYEYSKGENTLVGYPSDDGRGAFISDSDRAFAINNASSEEEQQGAWQFIRKFYDTDYQLYRYTRFYDHFGEEHDFYEEEIGIPINNKAFETGAERIINGEIYPSLVTQQGIEVERGLPSKSDYVGIVNYIKTVKMYETPVHRELWEIIQDEVFACFGGGQTLDDTVEHIQNRASIMVSEKS